MKRFKEKTKGKSTEGNFRIVSAKEINCTLIDFGIGSPQAAFIIHCLAYLDNLKSVIMLVMCRKEASRTKSFIANSIRNTWISIWTSDWMQQQK
jgi:hypothetical protein